MADELYINCARNISLEGLVKLAIRDADCENYLTCANKNESLESLLKRAFSMNDEGEVALNVCGCGGGGGGIVAVTYDELVALQLASGFTPGTWYLLTDFNTVHYFTDGSTTLTDINTGAVEQLLLLATAPSVLDTRAFSPTHPEDVIYYDWNPANWLTDVSFSSDGVNIVTGWKGIITYRWDTKQDNYTGYDFRNVKFRRWALAPVGWDNLTSYALGDYVLYAGDGNVYRSLIAANLNKTPGTDPEWCLQVDMTNPYWSWSSTSMNGIACDDEDFDDFYTFGTGCFMIHIEPMSDDNVKEWVNSTILNNIVFRSNCNTMTYGSNCYAMTYGSNCYAMTYGSNCNAMTYGSGCNTMTYGSSCGSITYGGDCGTMTYGSSCGAITYGSGCGAITYGSSCGSITYGGDCSTMTYGSSCYAMTYGSNCYTMTYGSNCYAMTYGSNCNTMTYGSGCGAMTFPVGSQMCDIKDGVSTVDLTLDAHAVAAYNYTIQICSNATVIGSYLDCTGLPTLTYVVISSI